MSEDEDMKREIWSIMCAKGIDFNQAKKIYRAQLEKSLKGYESQLDKEVAEEKERLFEIVKESVFAMVKDNYGIELIEDSQNGEIRFNNEDIFDTLVPLLKQLSSILAHPESVHVSVEFVRDENGEWEIKIINRAE